jgi:hypothetical protein
MFRVGWWTVGSDDLSEESGSVSIALSCNYLSRGALSHLIFPTEVVRGQ